MHYLNRLFCTIALVSFGCDTHSVSGLTKAPSPSANAQPATTRASQDQMSPEQQLVGTWVARDVDAKMGEVRIKLVFAEAGGVKLAAWSDIPFVGQVRDKKGPYEVHGNVVSSAAIRDGTSVEFHFENDDLIIQYKEGKSVRFHRG